MLEKVTIWLYAKLGYLMMKYWYGPWSRFYRKLFERKYKELPKKWTDKQILDFFKTCDWTKDKWYMLFDVISKPEKLYKKRKGDCDEYAAFAGEAGLHNGWIVSVTWYAPHNKFFSRFKGHNVFIFPKDAKWWHIGNWGRYGPYRTFFDALHAIYKIGDRDAIPCAWSVRSPCSKNGEKDLAFLIGGRFKKDKDGKRETREG